MLNTLQEYTEYTNGTRCNVNTTNTAVIQNSRKINCSEKSFYFNTELEIVDVLTYLRVQFKYNGIFDGTQTHLQQKRKNVHFNCEKRLMKIV